VNWTEQDLAEYLARRDGFLKHGAEVAAVALGEPRKRTPKERLVHGLAAMVSKPAQPVPPITLTLPLPPSVNDMWANVPGKGRVRTAKYREWRKLALAEAMPQLVGARRINGLFKGTIHIAMPNGGDLDNRVKACWDICKSAGAIKDDKGLIAMAVYRCHGKAGVRIHLQPATEDEIPHIDVRSFGGATS
jgi:crossover junction endodeoxyribonuclease RusA